MRESSAPADVQTLQETHALREYRIRGDRRARNSAAPSGVQTDTSKGLTRTALTFQVVSLAAPRGKVAAVKPPGSFAMLLTRLSSCPSSIQRRANMISRRTPIRISARSKYEEWIRDNPILIRSGVFTYKRPDGSIYKRPDGKLVTAYRSDEEVFI